MTHEIVKTENYLLVVDDSEIKEDDWVIDENESIAKADKRFIFNCDHEFYKFWRKIIAHLPLNNSPILQGVDLLPPLEQEDDVEKLADETYPKTYYSGIYVDGWLKAGFIKGYNKAKENLHEILSDFYYYATDGEVCKHETINEFIQSLSQPKMPTHFECEYHEINWGGVIEGKQITTTNNLGQIQWVGRYIYD